MITLLCFQRKVTFSGDLGFTGKDENKLVQIAIFLDTHKFAFHFLMLITLQEAKCLIIFVKVPFAYTLIFLCTGIIIIF